MASSTTNTQRTVIWVLAIVMAIGTLGSFFIFLLPSSNVPVKTNEQKEYERQLAEFQRQQALCPSGPVDAKKADPSPTPPTIEPVEKIDSLRTEDIVVGDGDSISEGDCVEIFYHGVVAKEATPISSGSNYSEGIPYRSATTTFLPGFSAGMAGMKVGGERIVFIPSDQAYGANPPAESEIPVDADLIFAIKVVGKFQSEE